MLSPLLRVLTARSVSALYRLNCPVTRHGAGPGAAVLGSGVIGAAVLGSGVTGAEVLGSGVIGNAVLG
jgi:hypothetical protein